MTGGAAWLISSQAWPSPAVGWDARPWLRRLDEGFRRAFLAGVVLAVAGALAALLLVKEKRAAGK